MSESNRERIDELMEEALPLPNGEVRVRLIEEAVRLAEETRDVDLMFETRIELVHSAVFAGRDDLAITAFAWCLARFEADPERFESQEYILLWSFKYILTSGDEFPQMSLDQIRQLRNQMASLYRQCGYSSRPVHYTRLILATSIGDRAAASDSLVKFQAEPRDGMADCAACEADTLVEYHDLMSGPEEVLEVAEPILRGSLSCAEVPHRTYGCVLRALASLDRHEEADGYQKKGYRLIRNNPKFLYEMSLHMVYLVHRNKTPAALRMFERHLTWALNTCQMRSQYYFYVAVVRLLKRLAEKRRTRKLDLPREFSAYQPSAKYDLATLIDWFDSRRLELGKRFDERNGNNFFTDELVERMQY